jgi:hypothetical protein
MFSSVCPSCGAPVGFRSTASATAICKFCKSTLVRDGESLARIGKQAELFDDASRIQIGTGATYQQTPFTVIGRIQLRYEAGYWNEWFILFPEGKTGWMSEASGTYAILFDTNNNTSLPEFDKTLVGQTIRVNGQPLTATDKRVAQCVAAEGELPFPLTDRWESKTIDFQREDVLATLDYSDPKTALFVGQTVSVESLKFSLLNILAPNTLGEASVGKISAKAVQALNCASCGASIKLVPSLTPEIICPQCNSKQTYSAGSLASSSIAAQAAVIEASKPVTQLAAGDEGMIEGKLWTVLGVLIRHADQDSSDRWEEYLMYNPEKQFAWLVFANYEWQFGTVLTKHPTLNGTVASVDGNNIRQSETYSASIDYVAGSFNWKAAAGDVTTITDYKGNGVTLSRESNASEVTWTKSKTLNGLALLKSFGKDVSTKQARTLSSENTGEAQKSNSDLAVIFSILLGLITAPAWVATSINDPSTALMIGLFALWVPLGFRNSDQD